MEDTLPTEQVWNVPVEKVAEAHKLMFNYLAGMSDAKIDEILNPDKVEK